MAKVKMLATLAGPQGSNAIGTERNCSEAEAKALVDGGFAVLLDAAPAAKPVPAATVHEKPKKKGRR